MPAALKGVAREVAALGLFGDAPESVDPNLDALVLAEFAGGLAIEFGGNIPALLDRLRSLEPDERRGFLLRFFKLDEVYVLDTGTQRINRLWNVLRANLRASNT